MPLFKFLKNLGSRPTVAAMNAQDLEMQPLLTGTRHATQIALAADSRGSESAVFVDIGHTEILAADDTRILYTDSLQSCFPVVFKFRDGRVALHHGNSAGITPGVELLLADPQLQEIQVFEKGKAVNSGKAGGFIENVRARYAGIQAEERPTLKHQRASAQDRRLDIDYGVAVIYRDVEADPVVIVGLSGAFNGMAATFEECTEAPEDIIHEYQFSEVQYPVLEPLLQEAVNRDRALRRQNSIREYYPYRVKSNAEGRWHLVPVNAKNIQALKEDYQDKKGDYLKTSILADFQKEMLTKNTIEDLNAFVQAFKLSKSYEVLATGQGILTKMRGMETSSVQALNIMVSEQEQRIRSESSDQNKFGLD